MSWFLTNLVSSFLLPPLNLLLIAGLGLWLWNKRPRIARWLLTGAFGLLWLFSTPYFAEGLLHRLESEPYVLDKNKPLADAIVVLGGGTYFHAPEYGEDTVNQTTLERVRFTAKLYRETGKPILVTSGSPTGNDTSEAEQMKQVLEQEFKVPVRWTENRSNDTFENANFSRELLKREGIEQVYLITHAWHMPRAMQAFQNAGFQVTPAPTAYTTRYRTDLLAFIPNVYALRDSRIFIHELIGMLWYQLKFKL